MGSRLRDILIRSDRPPQGGHQQPHARYWPVHAFLCAFQGSEWSSAQDHSATGRKRGRDGSESATRSDDSCNSHAVLQPEDPAPKRSKQEAAAQIATLRGHMQGWSAQLHRLQPKCIMDGNLIDHAIVFFIQAVRLRKEMVRLRPHCTASLSVSLRHRLLRANCE